MRYSETFVTLGPSVSEAMQSETFKETRDPAWPMLAPVFAMMAILANLILWDLLGYRRIIGWSVLGAGVLLAIAGALVWRAYRYTRLIQLIEQTPTNKIADLAGGVAAVQGSIVALKELLEAPLSGRRCVAFSAGLGHSELVHKGPRACFAFDHKQSVIFGVDDGTGRAEIDLTKFASIWVLDRESSRSLPAKSDLGGSLWDASDDLIDRARTHYGDRVDWVNFNPRPSSTTTYSETIIEEGAGVYALGPVSASNGKIQFTERPGSRMILAFGTREDYLAQFRKSARKFWLASFLVPTVGLSALRVVFLAWG